MQGLANGILFPTVCAYPSQWFKRRRGFATGIAIAGSSVGEQLDHLLHTKAADIGCPFRRRHYRYPYSRDAYPNGPPQNSPYLLIHKLHRALYCLPDAKRAATYVPENTSSY